MNFTTKSKRGKWFSNTYDPTRLDLDASLYSTRSLDHRNWLADKLIGPPQATDKYTVEQLQSMNMVGVYERLEVIQLPDGTEIPLT